MQATCNCADEQVRIELNNMIGVRRHTYHPVVLERLLLKADYSVASHRKPQLCLFVLFSRPLQVTGRAGPELILVNGGFLVGYLKRFGPSVQESDHKSLLESCSPTALV